MRVESDYSDCDKKGESERGGGCVREGEWRRGESGYSDCVQGERGRVRERGRVEEGGEWLLRL